MEAEKKPAKNDKTERNIVPKTKNADTATRTSR
jgi:hypothetical protein